MRRLVLFALPLMWMACDRPLAVEESAVHVDVSFDFNAGCIVVLARDKAAPDKQDEKQAAVYDRASRRANFAVFRKEDWGRTIEITVSARERTCEGPVVASQGGEFTLDKAGPQLMELSLHAPDEDNDGYVPLTHRGTDCDDSHDGSNPSVTREACDGRDNDCRNGVDDGFELKDFFFDGDDDGVGAGDEVRACSAPPDHVAISGDCDDADGARAPGKTETCDQRDNDCDDVVDDGLATRPYHRDADGDGYGAQADVQQRCSAPTGYVVATSVFDCDDVLATVKPGATEVCNGMDDNCAQGIDEGVKAAWYRDGDGDGFGRASDMQEACAAPTGYVAQTPVLDCDDAKPEVKPGAPELCNGVDDNCANGPDENFSQKGSSCTNDTCTGQLVCNTARTDLECSARPRVSYYDDWDGDGEGSATAAAERLCPPAPAPNRKVANNTDCDDSDPYNRKGGAEVCDDRDNNCSGSDADEEGPGNACGDKGWKKLADPIATAYNWNTVAVAAGGEPVWIAGDGGALAVRRTGATTFTNHHQACTGVRWNAAWVKSDGQVFLAGDGGNLAAFHSGGASCTMGSTTAATGGQTSNAALRGIMGFESGGSTTVYVLDAQGRVFAWTPGSAPVFKVGSAALTQAQELHGSAASRLLLVGSDHPSLNEPVAQRYDAIAGGTTLVNQSFVNVPGSSDEGILGVWSWANDEAVAVGKKGLLLWWDGDATWYWASQNGDMQVDLNSVAALDLASVYIASQDGKIRRPVIGGTGWVEHFTVTGPLEDIAATSRQNIWAVGNQTVVHFPE